MIARAVAEIFRLRVVETADYRELIAQRRERPQHGRELEACALALRSERSMDDAVADIDETEPWDRLRRVGAERG